MTVVLPYQEGDSICDAEAFTKVLNSSKNIETSVNNEAVHAQEVFMIHHPQSALIPPKAPDVRSLDELESNNHSLLMDMKVKLRARSKPEREGTS
jgi:hypothetical protein